MNYIAHALIADDFEHFMLGQILGDFAINSVLEGKHERLIAGVQAHRALDQFTDAHPAFVEGVKILETGVSRYAPVVMDVYMDRVLVMHWERFQPEQPFEAFLLKLYDAIRQFETELPERMRKPANRMRTMDWLSGFSQSNALERVFYYMAKRVRKPHWMSASTECISSNELALERCALKVLSDADLINFGSGRF